ncbi:proliferating cell nuclear antigen [Dendrothele bispora CBS 962.96]|uniref:DNA sliding clamp PCNA n=1 Tax=Dendrothele bispora (strain CBS 962.96) TaxID=1314807 RepID=A0A4S8MNY8_DENBC|nr:proliferating cell nuclear antigen [Dendrothele bispora CBS 962.96]
MLEAKLNEAGMLKKLLDAIKELVTDANFECNEEGINLQAMDNSHVALVSVQLSQTGFKKYRCDRPMPLGVNIGSLTKVLKCAKDDDICTLKSADDADILNLVYEAKNTDRIAEYELKLMDIDSDSLGIPDTDYEARVVMSSSEFARIVRDLSQLGESVRIEVSKEGVRFASDGEAANGNVLLKGKGPIGKVSSGPVNNSQGEGSGDGEEEDVKPEVVEVDEGEEDEDSDKKKKASNKTKVKKEKTDGDVDMEDGGDEEDEDDGEPEVEKDDEEEDEDEEAGDSKKRKKKANGTSKPAKKSKTSKGKGKRKDDDEEEEATDSVVIEMNSHVSLTFSLKYLVNFSKTASLHNRVQLYMSNEVPLLVSYDFGPGFVRYYLAPKIGDD